MVGRRSMAKNVRLNVSKVETCVKQNTAIALKRKELGRLRTQQTRLKQRQSATTTLVEQRNLQTLLVKTTSKIVNVQRFIQKATIRKQVCNCLILLLSFAFLFV